MQVERKPSRWPYVGMLIALLIACLLAPSYWQTVEQTDQTLDGLEPSVSRSAPYVSSTVAKRGAGAIDFIAKEGPYLLPGTHNLEWVAAAGLIPRVKSWPEVAGRVGLVVAQSPTIDELVSSLSTSPGTSADSLPPY